MNELIDKLNNLLAQRVYLTQNFYSYNINIDENTQRIDACLRLLKQAGTSTEIPFLLTQDSRDIYQGIASCAYCGKELLLILHRLFNQDKQQQHDLLDTLYQTSNTLDQILALNLALYSHQKLKFTLPEDTSSTLFQQYLLYCFYTDTPTIPSTPILDDLSQLYYKVLNEPQDSIAIADCFVTLNYVDSQLFDIFILSLSESSLIKVINFFSTKAEYIRIFIAVIAISGYGKCIPLLAYYMQEACYTQSAFNALKLLLGEQLDHIIPLNLQLLSDDEQRIAALRDYGVKIKDSANDKMTTWLTTRLLNGLPTNKEQLNKTYSSASQLHRRYANLRLFLLTKTFSSLNFELLDTPSCIIV